MRRFVRIWGAVALVGVAGCGVRGTAGPRVPWRARPGGRWGTRRAWRGRVLATRGRLGAAFAGGWRAIRPSLLFGFLNPFLYYLVLFSAYDLLPAQQAQALNYSWAVTLSLLAVPFLGQRIRPAEFIAIIISYAGVVVISTKGDILALHFESPTGVALALFSTLIWALYWIANTKDNREPVIGLFLNFICSLPMIAAYLFVTQGLREVRLPGLLGAVYVGIFEMGVAYILWLKALKGSSNTASIANLIFISPFLSLVMIHFLVGEEILRSTMVGLVFIISGLLLQSCCRDKSAQG